MKSHINKKKNNVFDVYLNITKAGTHQFNLTLKTVTEISLGTIEVLEEKNGSWYHNSIIYTNQVSELLNIKKQQKIMVFQLFLKSYTTDFELMVQLNKETKFKRKAP